MRSIPSFVHVRCGRRLLSTVTSTQVATRSAPVIAWSGARQLNIAETTNTAILSSYATKLENYINNDSVGLIAFSADGGKFFSKHMDQDPATVKTINQLNEKLMSYPKHTMLYAEGDISSSAFGTFSGCKVSLILYSSRLIHLIYDVSVSSWRRVNETRVGRFLQRTHPDWWWHIRKIGWWQKRWCGGK